MTEELAFLAADKPWERADVIVGGSNQIEHDPEVVIATALTAWTGPITRRSFPADLLEG